MNKKSILITGCSTGIGLRAAQLLKERGYQVFASARKPQDVEKLASLGFESVQLDVTDKQSIKRALETILQKTDGRLDALFNNAGFMQAGAIEDLTSEMEHAQFETNVFGPMELIRQVLPIMRAQGHGRIIQNSSILGIITLPYYGAYNASKFALEGFSNSLRLELYDSPIHLSIINPGPIESALRGTAFGLYQSGIKNTQGGKHQKAYEQLEKGYFDQQKSPIHAKPDAVVKKLIHALESKRPKAHYFVGLPAQVMAIFRRILPDSMLDWVLIRVSRSS